MGEVQKEMEKKATHANQQATDAAGFFCRSLYV